MDSSNCGENKTRPLKGKWRGVPLSAAHSAQDGTQGRNRQRALTNQQGTDSDATEKWTKAGTGITQEETQVTNKYLPIVSSSPVQTRKCKREQGSTVSTRDLPGSTKQNAHNRRAEAVARGRRLSRRVCEKYTQLPGVAAHPSTRHTPRRCLIVPKSVCLAATLY